MKRIFIFLLILPLMACSNRNEKKKQAADQDALAEQGYELITEANIFFQPLSSVKMEEPDPAAVELGKYLFYDTRLSGEGNISCNSCHNLNTYGVDNLRFSPGDAEGTVGNR